MSFQRFTVEDAYLSLETSPNTLEVMIYTHITCPSTKLGPTSHEDIKVMRAPSTLSLF